LKPTSIPQKTIIQDKVLEILEPPEDTTEKTPSPLSTVIKKKKVYIKPTIGCPLLNNNRIFINHKNFYQRSGDKFAVSQPTKERNANKDAEHLYKYNDEYFKERSSDKNALAISSNQSSLVDSFEEVKDNFNKVLLTSNLWECPKNWGGFSFVPYYFEFWEGNESRLNKRDVYQIKDKIWEHTIIQP